MDLRKMSEDRKSPLTANKRAEVKPEVVLLSNKICPVCGKPIVWYKKIYSAAYTVIADEIGQGYYRVKDDNDRGYATVKGKKG